MAYMAFSLSMGFQTSSIGYIDCYSSIFNNIALLSFRRISAGYCYQFTLHITSHVFYFDDCCDVLWMGWYFRKGGVVLWRGCGTLKSVVWYFWSGWCGTLKRVLRYFEEGGVVLWRGWCDTLKRVVWYLGGSVQAIIINSFCTLPHMYLSGFKQSYMFTSVMVCKLGLLMWNSLMRHNITGQGVWCFHFFTLLLIL